MDNLEAFRAWLQQHPNQRTTPDPGFSLLRIFTGRTQDYRGLVCSVDLPPQACCLSIPTDDPRLILTPYRCAGFLNRCGCFKTEDVGGHPVKLDPVDCLVLFMYHLRYPQSSSNPNSNNNNYHDNSTNNNLEGDANSNHHCPLHKIWQPYLNVLPRVYSDPVFGSFVDANSLPKRFHSMDLNISFRRIRSRLLDCWQRLSSVIVNDRDATPSSSTPPPEGFVWAWCTVNSRCVYCRLSDREKAMTHLWCDVLHLPPTDGNSEHTIFQILTHLPVHTALIPFFDFFNHMPTVSCNLEVFQNDKSVRLYVGSDVSAGKEVFINYGPHENLFLFLEYGFSVNPDEHPNDAVFPSSDDLNALAPSVDFDWLRFTVQHLGLDHNFDNQNPIFWSTVCLSRTGPSYHLLFILHVLNAVNVYKLRSQEALASRIDLERLADLDCIADLSYEIRCTLLKLIDRLRTQCSDDIEAVRSTGPQTSSGLCCRKSISLFLNHRHILLSTIYAYCQCEQLPSQ